MVELNPVGFSTTCLLTHPPIAGVILVSRMAGVEVEVYCTAGLPAAVQRVPTFNKVVCFYVQAETEQQSLMSLEERCLCCLPHLHGIT